MAVVGHFAAQVHSYRERVESGIAEHRNASEVEHGGDAAPGDEHVSRVEIQMHEPWVLRLFEGSAQGFHIHARECVASRGQARASTPSEVFLPGGGSDRRYLAQLAKPGSGQREPAEGATCFERRQQQLRPALPLDVTQRSRQRLSVEARLERDEAVRDDLALANVRDGKRQLPAMRVELAEEGRAGINRSAICFGVVDAYDLVAPVREHAGFSTEAQERRRIDPQLPEHAQQGRITEQVHRVDVYRKVARPRERFLMAAPRPVPGTRAASQQREGPRSDPVFRRNAPPLQGSGAAWPGAKLPASASSYKLAHTVHLAPTMAAVIETQSLTNVFRTDEIETHALAGIDLTIERNDYLAIVGPSGSGKSTLLAILGLMDLPTAGTFLWRGESLGGLGDTALSERRNREVGFIFQTFNLIGDLSVEQNVELPLIYRGVAARTRRQKVAAVLERVGMAHRARHHPSQLSGGQQQRVAVARALVGEPSILLADEPTGNLDSVNGESTMDLIDELHAGGSTICMVTHNLDYAQRARRLVRLSDGHLVEERV